MRSVEALARAEGVSVEEFVERVCDCGDGITFEADFEVEDPGDEDPEAVDTAPVENDGESRYRKRV